MKLYFLVIAFSAFMVAGSAWTQQSPPDNTAALAASMNVMPCSGTGVDPGSQHQCELRETARLFLIVGQREAALRILCETPALEVFRPEGALGSGKFEQNIAANRRCLEAAGIK